jgi:hypothetical protein
VVGISEILSLIIAARGVKPAVAMKTLSGRFRFVVLGVIVIVAVGCSCYFPSIPDTRISLYSVKIEPREKSKPPYVEWKSKTKFDNALDQLRASVNGEYCLCAVVNPGDRPHYPYRPYKPNHCPSDYDCPSATIRTVKVTKSKAADRIAAGESVANDPNVTWRVASSDPGLVKNVLDQLKP